MNREDQFEERLRRLPLRPLPAEWREEVLQATTTRPAPLPRPAASAHTHALWDKVHAWLWPHPTAWAGLGAAWLLILGLDFAARDSGGPAMARQAPPPSPQMRQLLREQEQLLAELNGPSEPARTVPARPPAAQPRSERDVEFRNA